MCNIIFLILIKNIITKNVILFFLFLTGAFIPKDIEAIITGLTICINPFSYIQLKFIGDDNFVSNYFDFGLENSNLKKSLESNQTAQSLI